MKFKKVHGIGLFVGAILLVLDIIYFTEEKIFNFILGISIFISILPFIIEINLENKKEKEISTMFLEFSRSLSESVTTGTPISKSIINMKKKNFGVLTPHIEKLANQIEIGIPVHRALQNFAYEVDSPTIKRAVALIREAERAGGEIDYILSSVATSISDVQKLKEERKAMIYNLVVQGYIIFFIFIGIMLVMEFKILPLVSDLNGFGGFDLSSIPSTTEENSSSNSNLTPQDLATPFLLLLLSQGILAGLTIGKLAEGSIISGIKHSFILSMTAFLVSTGVRAFF